MSYLIKLDHYKKEKRNTAKSQVNEKYYRQSLIREMRNQNLSDWSMFSYTFPIQGNCNPIFPTTISSL